jgi:hypothetical protein
MDTRSLSKLLQYLALPFMAASVFQKPLGLNEWAQPILGLIAVAFLLSDMARHIADEDRDLAVTAFKLRDPGR